MTLALVSSITEDDRAAKRKARRAAYAKEWRKRNPEKAKAYTKATKARYPEMVARTRRASDLRRNYGITIVQYDAMMIAQNGVCAICRCPCGTGKRLSVDHCHETKRVRALLCDVCNTTLGKMGNSPARLRAAADYLEKHSHGTES